LTSPSNWFSFARVRTPLEYLSCKWFCTWNIHNDILATTHEVSQIIVGVIVANASHLCGWWKSWEFERIPVRALFLHSAGWGLDAESPFRIAIKKSWMTFPIHHPGLVDHAGDPRLQQISRLFWCIHLSYYEGICVAFERVEVGGGGGRVNFLIACFFNITFLDVHVIYPKVVDPGLKPSFNNSEDWKLFSKLRANC